MRLLTVILFIALSLTRAPAQETYLVFAAASMKDAMEEIAAEYRENTGNTLTLSFAGTSILARQIERGAPADLFISADAQWMDWLMQRNLINKGKRINIAGNRLVIAVHRKEKIQADPLAILTTGLTAMANPDAVPAGRYAKQALTKLGIWQAVSQNVVRTENVRLALSLVARGEVEAAIVYESDVVAEPEVRSAFYFSDETHDKIRYPAAVLVNAKKGAGKVLLYFKSKKARAVFLKHGFQPASD